MNYGFHLNSNVVGFPGATRIYRSRAMGSTAAIQLNAFATAYVAHTQLAGPFPNPGGLTGLGTYDGLFQPVTCPFIP